MANPMEPKLIGLLAGPPWHLHGSGHGGRRYRGRGCRSDSPTSVEAFKAIRAALRLRGASGL
eukprot:4622857-Alexandrium_andersonii.AAC.1